MKLGILDRSKGKCCICGAETEARLIRYCEGCYKAEERLIKSKEKENTKKIILSTSGIPQKMREISIDSFTPNKAQNKAVRLVRSQIDYFGVETRWKMPYLYGPPGTGKTLIGIAACVEFVKHHAAGVKYIHVPDIMIDNSFYLENKKAIQSAPLLVLDDIGHHNTNQYSINILYNIINHRLMNQMGVMIISNFSLEELTNKFSKDSDKINDVTCVALRDRIMAMCLPVEVEGKNERVERAIKSTTKKYTYLGL